MKLTPNAPPEGTIRDWLAERAKEPGDRKSHIFTDGSAPLTWRDLHDLVLDIAGQLTALGIAKGESVAIMMPNGRDAVTALFGLLAGGFRATIINLAAGAEAVGYALSHSEARFALVADSQQQLFAQALVAHPNEIQQVTLSQPGAKQAELHQVTPRDDALLMYTSGTTGRPKGVVHSHASLLAGGWTTAIAHELTPEDRAYCVLPVYHINGLCVTVMAPLVSNGSVVMAPKFSKSAFWRDCATHQTTWFSVVPTVVSHLVHGDQDPDEATKNRLRFGRSASSALAPDVQTAFEARFDVPIVETMGLTETAAQILSNPLPRAIARSARPAWLTAMRSPF